MIAGVAGGIAEYLAIDVALVRIVWLVLLLSGAGVLAYLIAWIAIPEAAGGTDASARVADRTERSAAAPDSGRWLIGGALIAIGGWLLVRDVARRFLPVLDDVLLPLVLIAVGVGVIAYTVKR